MALDKRSVDGVGEGELSQIPRDIVLLLVSPEAS